MRIFIIFNKKRKLFFVTSAVIIAVLVTGVLFAIISTLQKKYLYPLEFQEYVLKASEKYGVDAALIFAVIKTESGFNPQAVSAKGAIGLMQITPDTGKYVANMQGVDDYDLFDPDTNISFGTCYWKYLSEKFCGITEIAAAYNAGEGTVARWLKNKEYSEDGLNLKRIPYAETDGYVKKIFKSLERYKNLYGNLLDK